MKLVLLVVVGLLFVVLVLFRAELKPRGYYLEHVFYLEHVIFTNMSRVSLSVRVQVFSAPLLRSCRFITVLLARLKVPGKNLPLVEQKRTSWLIPFLSTHTVKLMEMGHAEWVH